jgi:Na+-translocating ferredoxin:NAD+ oxidoreductase RnfG subunit
MKSLIHSIIIMVVALMLPLSTLANDTTSTPATNSPALAQAQSRTATIQGKDIPALVTEMYPKCDKLTEVGGGWIAVMKDKKLLGFIAYSKPASDGISGFKGETPLLICFNTKQQIIGVKLLPNQETPGFVARVQKGGLFDAWNGLTVSKAMQKTPDVVSGATYTSRSVIASMKVALQQLSQVTPSIKESSANSLGVVLPLLALAIILISLSRKGKNNNTARSTSPQQEK